MSDKGMQNLLFLGLIGAVIYLAVKKPAAAVTPLALPPSAPAAPVPYDFGLTDANSPWGP